MPHLPIIFTLLTRPPRAGARASASDRPLARRTPPRGALHAAVVALSLAAIVAACQQAPVTGRQQFILLPESQDAQMGLQAYQEIKQESEISRNSELNRRVQRVGRRIAEVSPHPEWDWEFTLFENDEPNAFALPGGKVGVNTGLFRVAKNDDQLAAVMGHEVAHAIARHGAERMSQGLLAQGLGAGAVLGGVNPQIVDVAAQAATLGVILPYSRTQESEADHIGLLYMAEAGYDPREAVELWRNFEALGGERPPEFLSTHPSEGTRIERLQELMPEAMEVYRANRRQ
jgi:metalloendopeptidase OMA1, mitochondrial